ncbi:MAG: hypothetical protein GY778_08855 [bacterium]|nr:hypothetical protein [bacterium]
MEKDQFVHEEFSTLRKEISATKARIFKTVSLGLVIVPLLTYLAEGQEIEFVGPIIPFVVLLLTILFVAEEQALMRCGRYIRERIEPLIEKGVGWEAWLESQGRLRVMDKCLFGCFVITFFVFYFASVGLALQKLWVSDADGMSGDYRVIAGSVVYGIGALWMIFTVLHHWRSCTATVE